MGLRELADCRRLLAESPPSSITTEHPRLIDGLPSTVTVTPTPVVMDSMVAATTHMQELDQVFCRHLMRPARRYWQSFSYRRNAHLALGPPFSRAGTPVAFLRSPYSTRPYGSSSTSYQVLQRSHCSTARRWRAGVPLGHGHTRAILVRYESQASGEQILSGQLFGGPGARRLGTLSVRCRTKRA